MKRIIMLSAVFSCIMFSQLLGMSRTRDEDAELAHENEISALIAKRDLKQLLLKLAKPDLSDNERKELNEQIQSKKKYILSVEEDADFYRGGGNPMVSYDEAMEKIEKEARDIDVEAVNKIEEEENQKFEEEVRKSEEERLIELLEKAFGAEADAKKN